MANFFQSRSAAAKVTIVASVGALIGTGLCSMGHMNFEGPSDATWTAGALIFWPSLLGLGVGLLWLLVRVISGTNRT